MVPVLRREKLLDNLKGKDVVYIKDLAEILGISLATIRRDLATLQQEGEVVIMRGGAVRIKHEDFDEPVVRKKLVNFEQKEIIARKAADLVQDGDCIYVDSGTTTISMLRYLKGKNVTVVSSSTQIIEYLPIKGVQCILLGGEVRADLASVFGALTEKMLTNMYFDKSFIGANGYVEDEGIYTYDPRESRKKEIVKENSQQVYVLMDTSKKNKREFTKVFDFNKCVLITELS